MVRTIPLNALVHNCKRIGEALDHRGRFPWVWQKKYSSREQVAAASLELSSFPEEMIVDIGPRTIYLFYFFELAILKA